MFTHILPEEEEKVLDSEEKDGETNERSERIRTLLIYASLIHANISSSVLLGVRATISFFFYCFSPCRHRADKWIAHRP